MEASCGACGDHIIERQRFAFSGWIAQMKYVVENVQGASDRGDDRFGLATYKGRKWVVPSENVPPDGDYIEDTTTVGRRHRVGCPWDN